MSLSKQVDFQLLFINKVNQENLEIKNSITLRQCVQIHIKFFALKVIVCFKINLIYLKNLLENTSSTTRVLLFMTIPGHLIFVLIIWQLAIDYTRLSLLFLFLYLIAALIQVKILLFY